MTLALLFPGQGVQQPSMLRWLDDEPAARPVLEQLAARLGADWRARCDDEAWATTNRVAQPLIVGLSLAAWAVLRDRLPAPAVIAGYSVGELAACSAAGVFDARTALRLADARAAAMDACAATTPGGLCAVSGLPSSEVEASVAPLGLAIALRNAADRCVIGGPRDALAVAAPLLFARGGEVAWLRIGIASHTAAMAPAAAAFARLLQTVPFERPWALVVGGLTGRATRDPAVLQSRLAAQLAATVEWAQCLDTIAERQPRVALEVGPGSSLSKMWNAAHPTVPARSADEFQQAGAVVAWVGQLLA